MTLTFAPLDVPPLPLRDDLDRLRWDRDAPRPPRPDPGGGGAPAFVGRVVTTGSTYGGKFVLVHPVSVTGNEVEGGPGTLTVDTTTTIPVYLLGPGAAQPGDDLVVKWADWRWVAERMGGGPTTLRLCSQIPRTDLTLSFSYFDPFFHVAYSTTLTLVYAPGMSGANSDTWAISGVTLAGYPGTHSFTLACALGGGVFAPAFIHGIVDSFGNGGSITYNPAADSTASPFLFDAHMPGSAGGSYFGFNSNEDTSVVISP